MDVVEVFLEHTDGHHSSVAVVVKAQLNKYTLRISAKDVRCKWGKDPETSQKTLYNLHASTTDNHICVHPRSICGIDLTAVATLWGPHRALIRMAFVLCMLKV